MPIHEGETYWRPGKFPDTEPKYLDDWPGWGYRHIAAKHGWNEGSDLMETEQALAEGHPDPQGGTKYLYAIPVAPGAGGVNCVRNVVVDLEADGSEPRPRGIVTSFNSVVP